MESFFKKIVEIEQKGLKAALCIVVSTKGPTPRKAGAKMLVYDNEEIYGSVGGGELERSVIKNARTQISLNHSKTFRHDLLHQHNMCCGGTMEIYIEPIMSRKKLYLFGAGHTGKALTQYAANLDFEIYVIDDRKEYLDKMDTGSVNKMHLPYQKALQALPFDGNTFVCIMTYSHPHDRDILAYCIKQPFAYLGMIGSRRKVSLTRKMFMESGIAGEKELQKVDMPMGLDIHAESPDEIAISILAKLVEVKNSRTATTGKIIALSASVKTGEKLL